MKLFAAFLRLVRLPNLVFIALTQMLFYYCIVSRATANPYVPHQLLLQPAFFYLIVTASVLIAAAGYIINDYFDLNIDKINKPEKLVVEKVIKRRWAIVWHLLLTALGVTISFYVGFKTGNWWLGFLNFFSAVLLWFYSTTFKKKLLIGNVIISLLTAWVVLVIYFCELRFDLLLKPDYQQSYQYFITKLFKMTILYAGFAFIISLIREVIKDMEDIQGDEKYGCRTMPIVWGIPASKVFAATWLIVLICGMLVVTVYAIQIQWWWSALYSLVLLVLPSVMVIKKLYPAAVSADYHKLSSLIKFIMLAGILSMIFFKLYT